MSCRSSGPLTKVRSKRISGETEPLCRIIDLEGSQNLATVFRVVTKVQLADMRLHEGQEIRFFSQEQVCELPLNPLIREILNQFFKPI